MTTWPMSRRVEHRADQLIKMMQKIGVDPAAAARLQRGAALAQARTTCLMCRATRDCDRWLADECDADPRGFCPNFCFFEACLGPLRAP